jgi:hypothetical protein
MATGWELPRTANAQREQLSRPVLWGWSRQAWRIQLDHNGSIAQWLGFAYINESVRYRHDVIIPSWFVCALLALPMAWRVRAGFRRWRRRRRGWCVVCGYDLRASAERCPECGSTAHAPVISTSAHSPA